jgi:hypothetical protein
MSRKSMIITWISAGRLIRDVVEVGWVSGIGSLGGEVLYTAVALFIDW